MDQPSDADARADLARLRAPVDPGALAAAVTHPLLVDVQSVPSTGSTNADLARLSADGAPEGTARCADEQTAGRGRLTRTWTSPPGSGIAVSLLLRPDDVPRDRWSWLPLLVGVAVTDVVRARGVAAALKWPNDVQADGRKLGGILVEVVPAGPTGRGGVVVGVGLNVTSAPDELPPGATSLRLEAAADLDRVTLVAGLLDRLAGAYVRWREAGGDPVASGLRESYALRCATLGRTVEVTLPGGSTLRGTATSVDDAGGLVVVGEDGVQTHLGAGDVVHVR